jgi:hypothetical protein
MLPSFVLYTSVLGRHEGQGFGRLSPAGMETKILQTDGRNINKQMRLYMRFSTFFQCNSEQISMTPLNLSPLIHRHLF